MTTGRGRGVDEEGRREGGRRGCRHEAAMISAKLKTRSRFEFDRSVEQIAMTGSVEKPRESTAEIKTAMVWQDLIGAHNIVGKRSRLSALGGIVVNRFSFFNEIRVKPHFLISLVNFC